MITKSNLHNKINFISLLLIVITLPFHILLCSYSITLFVINQIIEGDLITKIKTALKNKFVLTFTGFYLLHILGLVYTDNISYGLIDLEKKASLLVFPLLLFSVKIKPDHIVKILLAFVAACFALTVIYLYSATYNYIQTEKVESFLLYNLDSIAKIHRVYASMYFLFCIYILTYIHKKEFFNLKNPNTIFYTLILYFTVFIFLLTSRTMVILTVMSFIIITVSDMIQTKKILNGAIMLALFLFTFGSLIFYNDSIRTILSQTYEDLDKGNSEKNFTGPNQRIEIWKSGLEIVKENYFLGVGTGDTQDVLYNTYISNNFIWGIQNKFNAHNQYLQTLLSLGIFGLTFLMLCLFWPAVIAFSNKYYLYLGLIFIFSISCLTESMLCSQKGVVFYAFFNSLLAFHYPKKNA